MPGLHLLYQLLEATDHPISCRFGIKSDSAICSPEANDQIHYMNCA